MCTTGCMAAGAISLQKPHYIATLWFSEVVNDHPKCFSVFLKYGSENSKHSNKLKKCFCATLEWYSIRYNGRVKLLCLKVRSSEFLGESVHDLRVWVSWFLRMLVCGLVLDEKMRFRNDLKFSFSGFYPRFNMYLALICSKFGQNIDPNSIRYPK